jgi:response regulator RpfG family c-di-GMP phosphodiesterase
MNIKKIIRLSFILIILLIISLAIINSIVVTQIKDNHLSNNKIHDLVSFQSNMAFLLKDSIKTDNVNALNSLVKEFHQEEEKFEEVKDLLLSKSKKSFIDLFIEDIKLNSVIKNNLNLLFNNEKLLENSFKQAVSLQKEKFQLLTNFKRDYPTEKIIRTELENKIMQQQNLILLNSFGNIKYYSKETLFQHKNKKYLNKWLTEIEQIKHIFKEGEIEKYRTIVNKVGTYILQIEDIIVLESQLENEILVILKENQKVNDMIIRTIERLSSEFIHKTYSIMLLLALIIISFIVIFAYKVYQDVGLSVDEIESKIQDGLKKVNNLNKEIENTQKEVVFTMGAIGESRSKETGNHVKRVAEYSKILALYYGLSDEEAEMLKQASPMHDIGKVAIPDDILNKPGKFNIEEYEIMKTHADLGYKMLNKSNRPLLKMASIVAYEHHEKWDGTGYPLGKKTEDIHIYGRITALADVFDALGSDRVYKKAWDDKSIFELFKKERGVHFDPKLVDIFFEHLDDFLHIRDQFKDSI